MKPLYLHGSDPLSVALDGPALRVSRRGCADRRIPFERISRVVVSGRVSWSTDALLECADQGVVICFLKGNGMPRARWIGRITARSELAQRWVDFLDRPDWQDLYTLWGVANTRRAVRFCALRLGWSPRVDAKEMNRVIWRATRAVASVDEIRTIRRRLYGLAVARALEELGAFALDGDNTAVSQLVPDFAASVQWGLRPDLIRWMTNHRGERNRLLSPDDPYSVVSFFERHRPVSDFHLRDTVGRLDRYLEEVQ